MVATVTITLVILGGAVLFLDIRDHKKVSVVAVINVTYISGGGVQLGWDVRLGEITFQQVEYAIPPMEGPQEISRCL